MNMTSPAQIVERVLAELTGNPNTLLVREEIMGAMAKFCEGSWAVNVDLFPQTIAPDLIAYPIDIDDPKNLRLTEILRVGINGTSISPIGIDAAEQKYGHPLDACNPGAPSEFTRRDDDEILILPRPLHRLTNALTMRVSLAPRINAEKVPDLLVEKYRDEIIHGSLGRLMAMAGKPWTNGEMSSYHTAMFNAAVVQTKNDVQRGLVRAGGATKPRFF